MNDDQRSVLTFRVADRWFGLEAKAVDYLERMVEVTPLSTGLGVVAGVVDIGGRVIPVFSIRRRCGLPEREFGSRDFLLVAWAGKRIVAIVAEEMGEVRDLGEDWVGEEAIGTSPGEPITGFLKTPDGLILVYDLDRFLRPDEKIRLDEAMEEALGEESGPQLDGKE